MITSQDPFSERSRKKYIKVKYFFFLIFLFKKIKKFTQNEISTGVISLLEYISLLCYFTMKHVIDDVFPLVFGKNMIIKRFKPGKMFFFFSFIKGES